jgi:TatD DNase family protein
VCYNLAMNEIVRLIDTHAHLTSSAFDDDREAVLTRAAEAGVERVIEIGYDLPTSRAALALSERFPQIYAVVGLQPNHIHEAPADWLMQVRELAAHPRVVAIGEIGLDYYWMHVPPADQADVFRVQIDLARELGLPIVIHSRDAHADTLAILRDSAQGVTGVLHSFSGDWAYAQQCLASGFRLSFSGPLTFAKATVLHEVGRRAPLDQILIETDSPYLSPHPFRGRRNEPARVRFVAEKLAELREQPLTAIAAATWENAAALFRFPA